MSNEDEPGRILAVDDSPATLEVLRRNLEAEDYQVRTAASVDEALQILDAATVDLVITDVKMPRVSGYDLVRHVRENLKHTEVMVITGYPDVEGAVKVMRNGATDYLTKPFTDEELLDAVRKAFRRLAVREPAPASPPPEDPGRHGLLGESEAMEEVRAQIRRASRTSATVLLMGESGTGKELIARAIHYESARAAAPFVPVNCGAIPDELFESELFGHVKGAFTGADRTRAGFFLAADEGSIFLDEIGETSPAMQVKLLRVLQEKDVYMVGSSRPRRVDVRVLAATNRDLERRRRSGEFREDLYFRLNVLTIRAPPLRERGEDVILLAHLFARRFAAELDLPVPAFTDRAIEVLLHHPWPGNVRELENTVQRLVVMTEGQTIDAPDLPSLMRFSAAGATPRLDRTLEEVEAEYIRRVLRSVKGNKSQAARILGIDRKTLRSKLPPEDEAGSAED